ncbi:E3 ubiquitin/ISG15 ligase TRIM25 isoform X2 [Maylandia zebra]|nr:E3 ubiquitin/ISG15 ligase TRIM25 isoform X2 [Maylandia zebra]XP_004552595.1 E3 ubiquitin/ISG15 ligase TRIM25 isoform X2 [Maylandia zebra]XP_004552596.1 E3 ubiquitin/ISG15 ligase TRIM25 isoform X2 [Maylandia zebra]XP_026015280.1 E3 ubiquitin/ISG15 ligase TRIM25-like isoform X2 [Astatotilapia calliptera]XP_026015281.1 E3 ubiquitin/ISG15 ligase TRIM25-like isoform X2 [Astatotilapia calliptera]XP_026015282.1 E3 ubiquitin/ISG15 ligase TRIM25-like isoform X2 [Astatotilapia calliptera]
MSAKLWTEEQFNCPVCLDLPNDPVTIPCGHSYCMACIKDYWTKDDPKGIYSCPQCRQTFCPKPSLSRNTMLAEAVEQLRKGALKSEVRQSMRLAKEKLSSSVVPCDMCKNEKRAAVKSCLVCMSSYCEAHLKPHQTKKSLKQHELIPPTGNLAEKICTQHKYLQEFVCRQCKMFICWLCTSNQHKGHESVSTKVERLEKQKLLSDLQSANQQKLKEREQELKDMKKMMEQMKRSADVVHNEAEQVLSELLRSMERLQELLEEVMDQANQEKMGHAQEVTDSLEAEIKELKKRDTEMKDLASCEDNIYYLQTYESMCSPLESGDLPAVKVNHEASFEPVRDAILGLRERVEDLCNQELGKITKQVNDTTLFALGDSNRSGQKGGILKLFSGLSARNTNARPQASTPTISIGGRSTDKRGLGIGLRTQDVRSRDTARDRANTSSPRLQDKQRREDRDALREPNPRASTRSNISIGSSISHRLSPRASPTPSRRESQSLWSRSSQSQATTPTPVPASLTPAPTPAPAPARASTGHFSRMASISSIFRSNRRGTSQATPAAQASNTPSAGGNPWGMAELSETPTEINPGLFLDTPTPDSMNHAPAFPALREISLDSIQAPEPRTREEFLQYSVSLTLDSNTAHRQLTLSENNTKAALQGTAQLYPDSPQRFDGWTQVMCDSPLYAQRCYWEVEWRGRGSSTGIAYGAMARKGSDARSGLGYNAQSWTLELSDTCCTAMHDNQKTDIPVVYCPRVGIYLDLSAGTLSFYSVAESMTHLHTFRANFTQPLYATFWVGSGIGVGLDFSSSSESIKICPL